MKRFFLFCFFVVSATAQAALLLPVSGDKLGVGGHLKMHRTIAVDSSSPDSSIWVMASGESRVKALRINQQLLTATPVQLNRLNSAISIDVTATSGTVAISSQGLVLPYDDDGIGFFDGARIWKQSVAGLRIKPHSDAFPITVRNAENDADVLILKPATPAETIDGSILNQPVTPAGVKAVIDNLSATGKILQVSSAKSSNSASTTSTSSWDVKQDPAPTITTIRANSVILVRVTCQVSSDPNAIVSLRRETSGSSVDNIPGETYGFGTFYGVSTGGGVVHTFEYADSPGLPAGSSITYKLNFKSTAGSTTTVGHGSAAATIVLTEISN